MSSGEWLIVFEDDCVVLTQAVGRKPEDPFSTFGGWASEADTLSYADLAASESE